MKSLVNLNIHIKNEAPEFNLPRVKEFRQELWNSHRSP